MGGGRRGPKGYHYEINSQCLGNNWNMFGRCLKSFLVPLVLVVVHLPSGKKATTTLVDNASNMIGVLQDTALVKLYLISELWSLTEDFIIHLLDLHSGGASK
jgi:hypothetical protein